MRRAVILLRDLWRDESGQDLIEYALLGSLVALAGMASDKTLSNYVVSSFTTIGSRLTSTV